MRRALTLALLVLALLPALAAAQSDPFGPTPQPVAPAQDDTSSSSSSDPNNNDGLETWQELLIFGAGGILLFGIGWAIIADARQRAPTTDEELHAPKHDAHHQARKARQRQKQKIARASRKKNRPR